MGGHSSVFSYFPTNYVWNLSINLALEMGARIGEIDDICAPLLEISKQGDDAGTTAFLNAFAAMGDKLASLAGEELAEGHRLSAGTKLDRAATYYITCERMQPAHSEARREIYAKQQSCFRRAMELTGDPASRVEIPYQDGIIAGLFVPAEGVSEPAPLIIMVNGLDSVKEMIYRVGLPRALARRGISTLVIDQPGTGEALRLHKLPAVYNSEAWATPVFDYIATDRRVDPQRIGMHGVSLGGYYAPRAVAFEPRFALGVCWGANHNWGKVQRKRLAREGERPVPHYWEHVWWVFGQPDMESFFKVAERMTLDGVLDRIRVPFLVTHGEKDRQIPLAYAHQSFDQLINSPKRELKIFTDREGGVQHSSVDNSANAIDFQADWIADRFREMGRRV
jgi:dienelactone hydrolase